MRESKRRVKVLRLLKLAAQHLDTCPVARVETYLAARPVVVCEDCAAALALLEAAGPAPIVTAR